MENSIQRRFLGNDKNCDKVKKIPEWKTHKKQRVDIDIYFRYIYI